MYLLASRVTNVTLWRLATPVYLWYQIIELIKIIKHESRADLYRLFSTWRIFHRE